MGNIFSTIDTRDSAEGRERKEAYLHALHDLGRSEFLLLFVVRALLLLRRRCAFSGSSEEVLGFLEQRRRHFDFPGNSLCLGLFLCPTIRWEILTFWLFSFQNFVCYCYFAVSQGDEKERQNLNAFTTWRGFYLRYHVKCKERASSTVSVSDLSYISMLTQA